MSGVLNRVAASNIAWDPAEEEAVAARLQARGVSRVEIAPTKVFADPTDVGDDELERYRAFWNERGISIVAFQSMLFGREDLQVFTDAAGRRRTVDHLSRFIELAGRLSAGVLVFGSPKNRRVPDGMADAEARDIAVEVFGALGAVAADNGTLFCIEPNPVDYACNFVTDARQGIDLVDAVAHPGFGLHLDAAGMTLAGDDPFESIVAAGGRLRHLHVSAPFLGPIEREVVQHDRVAAGIRESGYVGTISIEMRPAQDGDTLGLVSRALDVVEECYREV